MLRRLHCHALSVPLPIKIKHVSTKLHLGQNSSVWYWMWQGLLLMCQLVASDRSINIFWDCAWPSGRQHSAMNHNMFATLPQSCHQAWTQHRQKLFILVISMIASFINGSAVETAVLHNDANICKRRMIEGVCFRSFPELGLLWERFVGVTQYLHHLYVACKYVFKARLDYHSQWLAQRLQKTCDWFRSVQRFAQWPIRPLDHLSTVTNCFIPNAQCTCQYCQR